MDVHIGDLHPSIVDREIEIVQELLEKIVVHFEAMAAACDTCAELDCLLSFADASQAFDYRRPEMVNDNIIDIKQGRYVNILVMNTSVIRATGTRCKNRSLTPSFLTMRTLQGVLETARWW
jgi:DNA mismatch repair protein MSH5